ncbi:hypothetical protein C8F04DRAFT_135765 [Mycena alexandri]|uniref:Uncharacterized protein n=1 Tax=Mycena alexandri TaxID=1745969 RepID=A0AAD6SD69_9AGAR|nr:hypothetical protein C8F04DRAFT_135765 [Mycena alexandri]
MAPRPLRALSSPAIIRDFGNTTFTILVFDHALVNVTETDLIPVSERDETIFDDRDSRITYSGSDWRSGGPTGVYRYEDTVRWTNTTNSTFSVPFNGVGITVIAGVDAGQKGNYSVEYYIDGSAVHVVDVSWPPEGFNTLDLSETAGGVLTIVSDATLPGNHTLQMTLVSISGTLPFALDYVVATGSLPSDNSWYHPDSHFFLVPIIWAVVNLASLFFFPAEITKYFRLRKRSLRSKKNSHPTAPGNVDATNIQLLPLSQAITPDGLQEDDPLIRPQSPGKKLLPSGLIDVYYDKGALQALYTPYTLWFSFGFGLLLIISGVAVRIISGRGIVGGATDILKLANRPPYDEARRDGWVAANMTSTQRTIFSICITTILTLVNSFISGPRATLLKWALAREGRLEFNSSSNFFITSGGPFSSTGILATSVYAVATVFTFASAAFITVTFDLRDNIDFEGADNRHLLFSDRYYVIFHYVPLVITGLCVSLQALITLASYRAYTVPTWSGQPFDVAAAAFANGMVSRTEGRCLADVNGASPGAALPLRPSRKHPSLSDVRPALSMIPPAGILLGTFIFALTFSNTLDPNHIFTGPTDLAAASISFTNGGLALALLAAFQAPLTILFHALDVAEGVIEDEQVWRRAAMLKGYHPKAGLAGLRPSGRVVLVFGSKVGTQWLYSNGITFVVGAFPVRGPLSGSDGIHTVWRIGQAVTFVSFYLYAAGGYLTVMSMIYRTMGHLGRSRTFQPATFGHIQTLVNAIDDWSEVMYWGHKVGGDVCHAGTSPHPLRPLQPKSVYM